MCPNFLQRIAGQLQQLAGLNAKPPENKQTNSLQSLTNQQPPATVDWVMQSMNVAIENTRSPDRRAQLPNKIAGYLTRFKEIQDPDFSDYSLDQLKESLIRLNNLAMIDDDDKHALYDQIFEVLRPNIPEDALLQMIEHHNFKPQISKLMRKHIELNLDLTIELIIKLGKFLRESDEGTREHAFIELEALISQQASLLNSNPEKDRSSYLNSILRLHECAENVHWSDAEASFKIKPAIYDLMMRYLSPSLQACPDIHFIIEACLSDEQKERFKMIKQSNPS
jgi:hypothetical protein